MDGDKYRESFESARVDLELITSRQPRAKHRGFSALTHLAALGFGILIGALASFLFLRGRYPALAELASQDASYFSKTPVPYSKSALPLLHHLAMLT